MRGRVLVVDDDSMARASVAGHFASLGLDVVEASDGRTGIERVQRGGPIDVVFLAFDLPDVDAVSVLRAFSEGAGTGAPPVVVISARELGDDALTAIEAGAIDVLRKPAPPAELTARVSNALRVARLEQDLRAGRLELQDLARTDRLTGLANRGHLDEHLSMASSGARRHNQPLAVLLVDVDHLRRVNEAEGHAAGDDVLRAIAVRVAHVLRGEDMAGRWGGEELLVLAPNTDLDGAWRLGERIRDAVSATPIPLVTGRDVLVTVSVGCATGDGADIDAHLRRAEAALEHAKAGGRNRVSTDAGIPD